MDVTPVLLVTSLVYYLQACSWNEDIFDTFDQLSLECWPTLWRCLPGASENATKAQDEDFLYWFTQNFGRIILYLSIPTNSGCGFCIAVCPKLWMDYSMYIYGWSQCVITCDMHTKDKYMMKEQCNTLKNVFLRLNYMLFFQVYMSSKTNPLKWHAQKIPKKCVVLGFWSTFVTVGCLNMNFVLNTKKSSRDQKTIHTVAKTKVQGFTCIL